MSNHAHDVSVHRCATCSEAAVGDEAVLDEKTGHWYHVWCLEQEQE